LQSLTAELKHTRQLHENEAAKVATTNEKLVKQAASARICVGWAILSQGLRATAVTTEELSGNFDESTKQLRAEHAAEVCLMFCSTIVIVLFVFVMHSARLSNERAFKRTC